MAVPVKRALDVFPVEQDGEPYFVMRDPEGVFEDPVALRVVAALVWDLMDGERDVLEVQEFIARNTGGALIPSEQIESIISQLDQAYLLETGRLKDRRGQIRAEFAALDTRPARFKGRTGYAEESDGLQAELDGYYGGEHGAGAPERNGRARHNVRGILSPHIDFRRGGPCYTHAYRAIAEAAPADLYLILGVAHCSPEPPFIPTIKSYDTPFGPAETDRDFMERLLKRTKRAGMEEDVVHRMEHSIEFQAVFLRHARGPEPVRIAPILCSSFDRHCGAKSPSTAAVVEDYLQAVSETIRESGKRVCVIAGVDLAHVGPRFGDRVEVDDAFIEWMKEGDKKSLASISTGDAEGFWGSVMGDGNRRKVCGLSATYAALRLMGPARGKLLRYTYAPDPAGGLVSFAAAEFR